MSRFSGKTGKGAARFERETKRAEAEERNANTPHERTKHHRVEGHVYGGVRVCPECPE